MRKFTWLLLLAVAVGCDEKKSPGPAGTASAGAKGSAAVSAKPAPPPAPWYFGTWQGTYEAQQYVIQMTKKQGAVKAWTQDAGEGGIVGEGEGKITLKIDEGKTITGEASGPLGDMTASGQVDEEQFRVRLTPKEPGEDAFQGFFLAKKSGKGMSGRLQASTGDSLKVRDAPVKLKRTSSEGFTAPPAASAP